jgi:hypothetical protein
MSHSVVGARRLLSWRGLAREHQVELIAIGNGTASRETHRLGAEFIRLHPELELTEVVVSEGTLWGIPRSPRNLPGHNSANRPRRRFGASWNGTILENGTALSSSRMAPAMLSSVLLRSKAWALSISVSFSDMRSRRPGLCQAHPATAQARRVYLNVEFQIAINPSRRRRAET